MTIHDRKPFNFHNDEELVKRGFAEIGIYKLDFDFYENETGKEMLNSALELYGKTDKDIAAINDHYDKIFRRNRVRQFNNVMDSLSKYKIYQYDENISWHESWDLFYYCNRYWNGTDEATHMSLDGNNKRNFTEIQKTFNEVLGILSKSENTPNIHCAIWKRAFYHEDEINEEACRIVKLLEGEPIIYNGMEGKIKENYMYDDSNYLNNYGFFKKYARNRYYRLSAKDVVSQLSRYADNNVAIA